ncbi:MAG TPA: PqqD family protein [Gemmatimonadaceae bacterium]|nr:PqqD family protein [Gemmatimonadaceae bacterium]
MTRYRVSPNALAASLSDGVVLLNLQTNRYFSLNETGTRVWNLLSCATPRSEIVATLAREYAVSEEEAGRTVLALLDELAGEQLIEAIEARS